MLIAGFPAGALAANCYLLAPSAGAECVVVDPGQDAMAPLAAALQEHGLRPVAVLLTHGHLDHVACAAAVGRAYDVTVYIHQADAYMLVDPFAALSPQLRAGLSALLPADFDLATLRPERTQTLVGGSTLDLAGLTIAVDHTPGHTGGSVVFRLAGGGVRGERPEGDDGDREMLLTGDTLFAGTVGRTDLPGGNTRQLLESIADKLLSRPDSAIVLPGHGPTSTIGAERVGNPFLNGLRAHD